MAGPGTSLTLDMEYTPTRTPINLRDSSTLYMTPPPDTPRKSLDGVTVLLTRALEDAQELRPLLEEHGAKVLAMPAIKRVPPRDWGPADQALRSLSGFDWLAFTSRHAVRAVAARLE